MDRRKLIFFAGGRSGYRFETAGCWVAQALERLGWTAYYRRDSDAAGELAGRAADLAELPAAAPAALPSALVLVGRIRCSPTS